MKIEISLEEIGLKVRHPIALGVISEMVEKELSSIAKRHREEMVKEMDALISSFVVRCCQQDHIGVSKILITTPDEP